MIKQPTTIVRTGIFNGNLEEAVKQFNPNVEYISLGLGNTDKWGVFESGEKSYLFIIARQKDKIISQYGYNTSMSITSYGDKTNEEVEKIFVEKSNIILDIEPPEWFKQSLQMMNLTFPVFEKNPELAMRFLKQA